jgi:hypothetical protein
MRILIEKKALIVLALCLMISLSCGGKVTTRTPPSEYKFTINGVVVKDKNLDKDFAYFNVMRDSDPFDGAVVKAGAYTLTSQGNGDYYKEGSSLFNYGQNVTVTFSSSGDDFSTQSSLVMPGNFNISPLSLPGDTLNPGGGEVTVTWGASASASGYVLSLVTPNVIPPAVGFNAIVKGLERTIPVEAFRTTQGTLVEGIYEVYLVAYYGSFPEFPEIAFQLPEDLPTGNISDANGTAGAGVVAAKKRIRVTVEQ